MFVVCLIDEEPKAVDCRQYRMEFPRRIRLRPYDIILAHREKWLYPDPSQPGVKLPSAQETTKYYCVQRKCIMTRFQYFQPDMIEIPEGTALQQSHKDLLKSELSYDSVN